MADMQFADIRQGGNRLDIVVIQRMSRIEAHAGRMNGHTCMAQLFQLGGYGWTFRITTAVVESMRIRPGMQLAHLHPNPRRRFDLRQFGIYENAGDNAGVSQA